MQPSPTIFNATFHALAPADKLEVGVKLQAGKLTMRDAVQLGHADLASVDDWVEFWHKGTLSLELREFLGLTPEQYGVWMREPSSLATSFSSGELPDGASDPAPRVFTFSDFIPMSFWGKDHWSTLAYVESVMVESAGFQVGTDARMKTGRRNFRVMADECRNPKRARPANAPSVVMKDEHSTKLNNGQLVSGHDDWSCVQDMAAEGLFVQHADDVQPKATLVFSAKGNEIANALREFKRNKGQFAQFRWPGEHASSVAG